METRGCNKDKIVRDSKAFWRVANPVYHFQASPLPHKQEKRSGNWDRVEKHIGQDEPSSLRLSAVVQASEIEDNLMPVVRGLAAFPLSCKKIEFLCPDVSLQLSDMRDNGWTATLSGAGWWVLTRA